MAPTVTEAKFNDLKAKLRELFELDKSDLDFGIYRIMAAKNREVNEFLDRQLKAAVRDTLAAHGTGAAVEIESQIHQAEKAAQAAGFNPDESPTVKELKARLASGGAASASELEADIYNHLLAFFSRYYDEGDFISKRRYKGDVYAIPYNGQEVTLHWANKDQYYIKSGEWHKDYRFKAGGKTVHFKLVEATQEANNNKEPDDAKRRFILAAEQPVETNDSELTLRFEFRVPTEAEKQAVPDCTRIFGGKYAAATSRTKGDEREQFCADAEQRALAAMPETWKGVASALAPTEAKPARTVLGRHLEDFTARNTFDYFIHKDLGGFLNRELDFYIKNEVVRLDDLEALPADHLARIQGKVKAIRTVAGRIIDFLASIENFQKKIWLKKKFVLETNYCFTLDRVPEALYPEIAANDAQREEWVRLFAIDEIRAEKLGDVAYSKPLTAAFLKSQPHLVLDTKHLAAQLARAALAAINDLEGKLDGLLIHSENFQALQLIEDRYRGAIDCLYIDPPFNLGETADYMYRVDYKNSTWLSLIGNRLALARSLVAASGGVFVRCSHDGNMLVRLLMEEVFGPQNYRNEIIVRRAEESKGDLNKQFASTRSITVNYDNIYWFSVQPEARFGRFMKPTTGKQADAHWHGFWKAEDRPSMRYELLGVDLTRHYGQWMWSLDRASLAVENYRQFCEEAKTSGVTLEEYWERTGKKLEFVMRDGKGISSVKYWIPPRAEVMADNNWLDVKGYANKWEFKTENSEPLLRRIVESITSGNGTVLDFFLGSGTTCATAQKLRRRWIGAEMGPQFDSVAVPRMKAVLHGDSTGISELAKWRGGGAFKYLRLESYEDALNNLPAPTGELLAHADSATKDALITYSLDLEMGPKLLNLEAFRDPWGYSINAQPGGAAEIKPHRVDLVETFNYLLGLKVKAYGPLEQYSADFVQAEHDDNLGRLKAKGRLKRDAAGPFVFQRVEGELLDGTRVLIIWRKLTAHAEQDAAALEAWMLRHREETKERSDYREYHQIYINGPVTLPQPTAEIRTVMPIEQTFKDRMFADREGD